MKNVFAIIALCMMTLGCNTTVEPGHTGVVTDWGEVQGWTYNEGFHWISPFHDVYELNVQTQALHFSEGSSIAVLSKDRLNMGVDVTVQYQLAVGDSTPTMFQKFFTGEEEHYTDRVIVPAVRTAVRDVVSRLDAMDAVQQRDTLSQQVSDRVTREVHNTLANSDVPGYAVHLVGVQIRNIGIPQRLQESIARIQQAENQALERQQQIAVASQEAERARIEAEGALTVARINAERTAESRRISAQGTADANRLISASITPNLLRQQQIQAQMKLAEHVQTVIMGGGSGSNSTTVIPIPMPTNGR